MLSKRIIAIARGRRTLRLLLDAAAEEFGEKGFHEASISQITQRAGIAIGSFYTYFDSKEEVFTALVRDLSGHLQPQQNTTGHHNRQARGEGNLFCFPWQGIAESVQHKPLLTLMNITEEPHARQTTPHHWCNGVYLPSDLSH